ncbi:hypothetical protein FD21_GL000434 [Liquorilactobacillus vini DSM 20605]|uniref:HTH lacI-type domain-containing protein n=2 Tax=Liquorilactobacillus vini TaxID=238015 RepID=A0A0R2BSD3_9LACO|nr:hypothetical protein FD21_GL000434 [Liquorilactobacillus vini DSM 20605]
MQTIANKLNISKNSVSIALRGKDGVSKETRERVIELANKLDYHYFSRKSKQHDTVIKTFALVSTDFTLELKSFFGVILDELQKIITSKHYKLVIFKISNKEQEKNGLPVELASIKWDGIFVLSFITNDYIKKILSLKIPVILIDYHNSEIESDSILTQNIDGMERGIAYLARRKIKSIGFIGNTNFSPSYYERLIGFYSGIKKYNLQVNENYVITSIPEDHQKDLFNYLASLKKMPDAWVTVNNGYGLAVMSFLHSKGYTIPEDVSILSFDNTDLSRTSHPQMSVIATDLKQMAKEAFSAMNYRLKFPYKSHRQILLLPALIKRESA